MPVLLENKKARFDYEVLKTFEAGLELRGWEVKSIRGKMASLAGARAIVRGGEVYIVGLDIRPSQANNLPANYEEGRVVRLLLSKKEISELHGKLAQKGLTLVPIRLYTKGKRIKAQIALVKGKKKFEKRDKIKERESKRKIERTIKNMA